MPNHITNEVCFSDLSPAQSEAILQKVSTEKGEISFNILLPMPLNIVQDGCIGEEERKIFPDTWHEWCSNNWGTKWDAYISGNSGSIRKPKILTLRFKTAWRPPYGWLITLYNYFHLPFSLLWKDEGDNEVHYETFGTNANNWANKVWKKLKPTEKQIKHMKELFFEEKFKVLKKEEK